MSKIQQSSSKPLTYSKSAIKRAGETLIRENSSANDPESHLEALKALSYWRASHLAPLEVAVREVEEVARFKHRNAIIAKRLKRAPSIIAKLKRYQGMDLQNMQDIGGCRVILPSIRQVNQLRRALSARTDYRLKDYLKNPKEDGYRGIHLIGKFSGKTPGTKFQIEIQLRTEIQHAWATAVEIIDLFTKQQLKANDGKPQWQEFFSLAADALSTLDGTPTDHDRHVAICTQVAALASRLNVLQKFAAFSRSLHILEEVGVKGVEGFYLLKINTVAPTLSYDFFPIEAYDMAVERYLQQERTSLEKTELVVALVSTNSLSSLKEAYPNYFADSGIFVGHLHTILARAKAANPNWVTRFFLNLAGKSRVPTA